MALLKVEQLTKSYANEGQEKTQALKGISLSVEEGKVLGIVGESGSGKSTLAKCLLGIESYQNGQISYRNQLLTPKRSLENCRQIQFVFQDPYASLNPRLTIEKIIGEGLRIHQIVPENERRARVLELLRDVGLEESVLERYPHEFSGGQRQRIVIARALAVEPELLVCDEPIASLDISIQAQIINLLLRLQKERKLTMIFIAHDLSIVRYVSDDIAVMCDGRIAEFASTEKLYEAPQENYTQLLLAAMPTTQLI
ncbi:ATP-binding cassette domain-containing protein [Vagococcus silagei]|uniref:ABC transporter ATP-binding protein n=1 Tax=Vagococcus silagei TaxID=2508885 RepID=A0A4S3B5I6_9ENTE|nr:ATP-binding cassette domain-containing protein [Vagococcus silagei]THB61130.1 ABC transporter ATP-binding protein [Vagococcus silagei]